MCPFLGGKLISSFLVSILVLISISVDLLALNLRMTPKLKSDQVCQTVVITAVGIRMPSMEQFTLLFAENKVSH